MKSAYVNCLEKMSEEENEKGSDNSHSDSKDNLEEEIHHHTSSDF